MVAALPEYLRDFTRFAYLTGRRKGEIASLKWTDVDRDAGTIRLRSEAAKTGRGRTVMLEGDLAECKPSSSSTSSINAPTCRRGRLRLGCRQFLPVMTVEERQGEADASGCQAREV